MSASDHTGPAHPGFSERKQEAYDPVPTEPEAFLRWAATRPREEGKYELADGVVQHTMINVTWAHSVICMNWIAQLVRVLDLDQWGIASADFAVRVTNSVRGPDILVTPAGIDLKALSTENPVLLVEVLSPSSVGRDFTEKLAEYTDIASLRTYVICSQDEPRAWVWARQSDGSWPERADKLEGRARAITLGGLGIGISMAAIFRGIPDAPTP